MSISKPPSENSAKPAQIDKFRDLARELECDDDDAVFAEKVKKLAGAKPKAKDAKSDGSK